MPDQHDVNVPDEPRYTWTTTQQHRLPRTCRPTCSTARASRASRSNTEGRCATSRRAATSRPTARGTPTPAASTRSSSACRSTASATTCSAANARPRRHACAGTRPLTTGSPSQRGTYGYYSVRSNGVDPSKGFITEGNIHTNNVGLFVQDAWTIGNRLTINVGLRTEREEVPTYTTADATDDSGVRHRVRLRGQARAARRLRLRPQGRRQVEGVRLVGHLLRHLQARTAARLVRRRQVDRVLLHARHARLARRCSTTSGCPPACPGTFIRVDRLPSSRRSGRTRSSRT